MSYKAGSAYCSILPDFTGFHRRVASELKASEPTWEKFGVTAGKRFTSGFKDSLRAGFAHLPSPVIRASADTARASEQIDRAARNRKSRIEVDVSWLRSPLALGALGGLALGPQALGLGAAAAGGAVAFGAAAAGIASYAAIAVPMFTKITTAQKKLAAAQAQYDKATTKSGRASALKAEAAATAGLTVSERGLAKELTGLQGAWHQLQRAEEPVVARSLTPWLSAGRTGLSLLRPVITDTAQAIGFLGRSAGKMLQDPFWKTFSRELGSTARESLTGFGSAAMHAADGLGHLFVTFAPDIRKIPPLIDGWAGSFDRWARSYNRSGFDRFMNRTFSSANLSVLKSDGKALATTLGNVAKATAQISPAAFLGLSKVLEILSKLSPGQIEAVGAIYAISRTAGGLGNLASLGGFGKAAKGGGKGIFGAGSAIVGLGLAGGALIRAASDRAAPAGTGPGNASRVLQQQPGGAAAGAGLLGGFESQLSLNMPRWWSAAYEDFQRDFAGKITSWFRSSLPHAFGAAGGALRGAGISLAHGLGSGWNSAAGWVRGQFGRARSWATGTLRSAGSWLTSHGRSAARGFGNAWNASGGWVRAQFGRARGWATGEMRGAGSWLVSHGRSAASGLASGWNRGRGLVAGAVGRAFGWVTAPFRGAGSWLAGAGSAVLGGFLHGLEAGWGKVTSFVSGIGGWIAAHKGPVSYDYRLLQPAGQAIMGGFHDSLRSGFERVQALTASMAPQLSLAVPGGLPGVTGPATAGALRMAVDYVGPSQGAIAAIVKDLRYTIQHQSGGDVQRHLGQGKARVK